MRRWPLRRECAVRMQISSSYTKRIVSGSSSRRTRPRRCCPSPSSSRSSSTPTCPTGAASASTCSTRAWLGTAGGRRRWHWCPLTAVSFTAASVTLRGRRWPTRRRQSVGRRWRRTLAGGGRSGRRRLSAAATCGPSQSLVRRRTCRRCRTRACRSRSCGTSTTALLRGSGANSRRWSLRERTGHRAVCSSAVSEPVVLVGKKAKPVRHQFRGCRQTVRLAAVASASKSFLRIRPTCLYLSTGGFSC
mmetsp:Transcript_10972/g.23432  ORF Transcript_10972/g.23432 Transcript_10972/m.23432 type:complete len:247 (-) Transcript_10972:324-1064(-)